MKYMIPIENIEQLRKKAAKIQKKAATHNCAVIFEELGEVFQEEKNEAGEIIVRKYIEVEAEGEAKAEGWVFAGTIEHTPAGNILRSVSDEYKIPERYRSADPFCEHCKTKRARKDTYVVFNESTNEFKQLGKSCLMEYTNGLSVEMAALILQWLRDVEESCYIGSGSYKSYFDVFELSKYFVETMRKFGWASSSAELPTKTQALDFWYAENRPSLIGKTEVNRLKRKAESVDFSITHVEDEYINAALDWAKNWNSDEYNDYRENLKVISSMQCCEYKHLGYLASLFMAYDKDMEREIKRAERNNERSQSEYAGEVGEKIDCEVKGFKCLTAWDTDWGTTFLYEFVTEDGNILIWKTSKWIDDEKPVNHIKGTVKNTSEFRGVKQTELTRCKVA